MGNIDRLNQMNLQLNFNNIDPEKIQTEETINAVFIVDISPSVQSYVGDLNAAFNDFVQTMQASHVSDRLLASIVEFNENINPKSGFQPITAVPNTVFIPSGYSTSLYDAVLVGIHNAVDYRESLKKTGVMVKTLVFVITDGEDNSSKDFDGSEVKKLLEEIKKEEDNVFSFTTILFGVGNQANFEAAKDAMGIEHMAKVGNTGKEIRKMINFISSSISNSSSGQSPVSGINF